MIKFVVICEDFLGNIHTYGPFDNVAEAQSQEFKESCKAHTIVVAPKKKED